MEIIDGMHAVTLHINDIEKARKFYSEILGLKEIKFSLETKHATYSIPNSKTVLSMHVMDENENGREAGTVTGIKFTTADPYAAVSEIKKRGGIVVEEAAKMPWGSIRAVIADFDGNEFIIEKPI